MVKGTASAASTASKRTPWIGPAQPRDLADIVRIDRSSFPQPWTLESYAEEVERPTSHLLLARPEKRASAVAFACAWQIHDEIQLLKLATSPDYRGQGYAQALLHRLVTDADKQAVALITLELRQANERALRLYQRFGFKQVGFRRSYYQNGDDAWLMARSKITR